MRAQPVADHLFPSADGGLGPGAFRVPGRPLPGHAPVVGDMLEVAVARRRIALGRLTRHGGRARRHDNGRLGGALGGAGVNTVLIVRAIARDGGHRPRVSLVSSGGLCGSGARSTLTVQNGSVRGGSGVSVSGQVGPGGSVSLALQKSGVQGSASGTLAGSSGSGSWSVSSLGCSGHWTARRA